MSNAIEKLATVIEKYGGTTIHRDTNARNELVEAYKGVAYERHHTLKEKIVGILSDKSTAIDTFCNRAVAHCYSWTSEYYINLKEGTIVSYTS